MEIIEMDSGCRKPRSSARISKVKSYSNNYENLDEISDTGENSGKDRRPKKRAKMSSAKKDNLAPCKNQVSEIKANVSSNTEKKLFPIFTSSPKLQTQQKISSDAESKIEFAERSSQNDNRISPININQIKVKESNENLLPLEEKHKEGTDDVTKDHKVISCVTSANCINNPSVKNEKVSEIGQILTELEDINKNNTKQISNEKLKETPVTNSNDCEILNTSSEDDKIVPLKKKRKKKNLKSDINLFTSTPNVKIKSKIFNKNDTNTTAELKNSKIKNDGKINVAKSEGALKLFPIFGASYSSAKILSPDKKKVSSDLTDCVQIEELSDDLKDCVQMKQLSDDITNCVQTEQQSGDITDSSQTGQKSDDNTDSTQTGQQSDDITDYVQTEQHSDDITDGVQSTIIKEDSLAASPETTSEIIVIDSKNLDITNNEPFAVTHHKEKLNKSVDSVVEGGVKTELKRNKTKTAAESKVNSDLKIKVAKPGGTLKLFPLFNSSVKCLESSPEAKEKRKLSNDSPQHSVEITDCVETVKLSNNSAECAQIELPSNTGDCVKADNMDFAQTEQISNDTADYVQTDNTEDCVQTDDIEDSVKIDQTSMIQDHSLSSDKADCVQSEQSFVIKGNSLETSYEPTNKIVVNDAEECMIPDNHDSSSVTRPIRKHQKRKSNKLEDSATITASARVTYSRTVKDDGNRSLIAAPMSPAKSDNIEIEDSDNSKRKSKRNKTRTVKDDGDRSLIAAPMSPAKSDNIEIEDSGNSKGKSKRNKQKFSAKSEDHNVAKLEGTLKLFPLFNGSVKTSESSAKITENKKFSNFTDSVQQSDEIADFLPTEPLSNITENSIQSDQSITIADNSLGKERNSSLNSLPTKKGRGRPKKLPRISVAGDSMDELSITITDNSLATSHDLTNERVIDDEKSRLPENSDSSITRPVRTCKKQKLNKLDNSATVTPSTRITRSRTERNNDNASLIAAPLSPAKADNVEIDDSVSGKRKIKRHKAKTEALKLLPQSHQCFQKKKKDSCFKKVPPTKLFPLFSKPPTAVIENKSISSLNSLPTKNGRGRPRKLPRLSDAGDTLDELSVKNNTNNEKMQSKNNEKMKRNSKISKRKHSDVESLEISDDSIVEIEEAKSSNVETKTKKHSKKSADLESVNKIEIKNTTVPKKNWDSVSSKTPEIRLPFPLITQCYAWDNKFDSNVSKYCFKEDNISGEIEVPLWNQIAGLTDIKSINAADLFSSIKNDNETTETKYVNETNNALWTDISNDYNLKEGVSEATIAELKLWLSQWKSRFTKNDRPKRDSDDSFDSFASDSNDSEAEHLSNSMIIMGPPGCGKTSLVFSLANDHGFKVLEVNASSCRNGRNISHQLKEALESYHVENIKTAGLNLQKEDSKDCGKDSVSTKSKKNKVTPKGDIAEFLQKGKKSDKNEIVKKKSTMKNFFQGKSVSKNPDDSHKLKKTVSESQQSASACLDDPLLISSSRSISTRTIILFDDIDVVFQEDEGLWSTIRNFLKISKKPVIFTVSRNLAVVKANLDSNITVLHLKPMIEEVAMKKINGQYKVHNRKNSNINMKFLINNSNDVRRNLLHTQFWSQPCDLHLPVDSNEVFSANTFLLGSLNSSPVDFISLISKNKLPTSLSVVSDYHKIGYDLFHSNLFTILNGTHSSNIARSWQSVTKRTSNCDSDFIEDLDAQKDNANSDLWKEACKIFELKKLRLGKGSSSDELFIFSNILQSFSFADSLKGCFTKSIKWISQPERIHLWNLGLPACSEENEMCFSDSIMDMVSMIQILALQFARNNHSSNPEFKKEDNRILLEHPFMNCDDENEVGVDSQLESIASGFSGSHMLNKTSFNLDYLSTLKIMCREELLRRTKSGKRSNRFLHYFDSISLYIDKSQIEKCVE